MGVFSLGPSGAALGTTLSQMCSVLIALVVIIKNECFRVFVSVTSIYIRLP